jgi:hypothetical protein
MLTPKSSDRSLVDAKLVFLGETPYRKGAKEMFDVLKEYRSKLDGANVKPGTGDGGPENGVNK